MWKTGGDLRYKSHQRGFSPWEPINHRLLREGGRMRTVTCWDGLSQFQGFREDSISHNTCSYQGSRASEGKENLGSIKTVKDHLFYTMKSIGSPSPWEQALGLVGLIFLFLTSYIPQHRTWRAKIDSSSSFQAVREESLRWGQKSSYKSTQPLTILAVYWKFRKGNLSMGCTEACLWPPGWLLSPPSPSVQSGS